MKQKIIKTLRFFVFLSFGILLLYFAFKGVNSEYILSKILKANYLWIALSLILAIGAYVSRAYRWRLLINSLGDKPKIWNVFNALIFGYFANFLLPRFGEIVRCGSLKKTEGISFKALVGTVIVERAIDLMVLLLLTCIAFISKINFFGNFLIEDIIIPIYNKFLSIFDLAIITWLLITLILTIVISILYLIIKKLKLIDKFKKLLLGVFEGLKSIKYMKNKKEFIFHTIFIWTMYFLMTYVVFFSLNSTSHLTALDGLFILVVGGLGMSTPVQGGIGAFHYIVSKAIALYGISLEDGLAFATISHESQALLVILLTIFSSIAILIYRRKTFRKKFNATNPSS